MNKNCTTFNVQTVLEPFRTAKSVVDLSQTKAHAAHCGRVVGRDFGAKRRHLLNAVCVRQLFKLFVNSARTFEGTVEPFVAAAVEWSSGCRTQYASCFRRQSRTRRVTSGHLDIANMEATFSAKNKNKRKSSGVSNYEYECTRVEPFQNHGSQLGAVPLRSVKSACRHALINARRRRPP